MNRGCKAKPELQNYIMQSGFVSPKQKYSKFARDNILCNKSQFKTKKEKKS